MSDLVKASDQQVKPPPVKRDRHASLRYGLQMVGLWLETKGWRCNAIDHSSVSVSVQKGDFMFDVKIWRLQMANIAFVTSSLSYVYDPKKINAKVTRLQETLPGCEHVVHVIGANKMTLPPIYIPVPATLDEDPAVFLARSVLNTLNILAKELAKQGNAKLQEELKEVPELDFESLSTALDRVPESQRLELPDASQGGESKSV